MAKQASKKDEPEVAEISKEERNRLDRIQMLEFIKQMRMVKQRQIKACYDVLMMANRSKMGLRRNYQEITLALLMNPLHKLLNLSTTRFDSIHFVQHLMNANKNSPFFKIKGELLTGLVAVADQKYSQKVINDISSCLHSLFKHADFADMGIGSLKICLTIANFVLKD
jgi:histidinol phosphatase-like enzyme